MRRHIIPPTPEEDAAITAAANADPDARPFTDAEWERVKATVRRGANLKRDQPCNDLTEPDKKPAA